MARPADGLPLALQEAVLGESESMPEGSETVRGHDFNSGCDMNALMASFMHTGFQATNLALAIAEVRKMRAWRLSDEPVAPDEDEELRDPAARAKVRCTIFMGVTSNLISAGTRETIRWLVEHRKIDCLVTTGGGIEEDIMKCLAPHCTNMGCCNPNPDPDPDPNPNPNPNTNQVPRAALHG